MFISCPHGAPASQGNPSGAMLIIGCTSGAAQISLQIFSDGTANFEWIMLQRTRLISDLLYLGYDVLGGDVRA